MGEETLDGEIMKDERLSIQIGVLTGQVWPNLLLNLVKILRIRLGWICTILLTNLTQTNSNINGLGWVELIKYEYLKIIFYFVKKFRAIIYFCLKLYKYVMTKCTQKKKSNCDNI